MEGSKTPRDSMVEMTEIVLPQHTNALGSIFGGVVLSWVDIAAAICATRHSGMVAITASFDAMNFLAPIHLGAVVSIKAKINHVARTSCEIGVTVNSEDPLSGKRTHTANAFVTMVTLGADGKPASMPPLRLETDEDHANSAAAQVRRQLRLELKKLKA